MKRFISIYYVLAISLFLSCGSKSGEEKPDIFTEKDFGKAIELEAKSLQLDAMIMQPVHVRVFGNLLFLQNIKTDYHYEIYNLETNTKINECIKFGNGAEEMIRPRIIKITDDDLWIYDMASMSLYKYKLKDFISTSKPSVIKRIRLGSTHYRAGILSDNRIIASPATVPEKMFDLYDAEGKLLKSKDDYPNTKLSVSENILFYKFEFVTNLDDKVFVTYMSGDIIEIHDEKIDKIKRRWGPNKHKPVWKLITEGGASAVVGVAEETYQCYHGTPVRAENEVFVMYYGDFYDTFESRVTKILVFDFEGNPLRKYNLSIPIRFFDVDTEKRIIYGITDLPEEYNIVKFEY
jgi:hypothetical protein